jgi:hypothetical protein
MPGHDLPGLEECLRQLPAALTVGAPAGLAERIAARGRPGPRGAGRPPPHPGAQPPAGPGRHPRPAGRRPLAGPAGPARRAAGATRRAAVVWTGRQLVYWGGGSHPPVRARADGAGFNPGTNRWATLPPAPEGQWHLEGDDGVAVWTGREVLVWGA